MVFKSLPAWVAGCRRRGKQPHVRQTSCSARMYVASLLESYVLLYMSAHVGWIVFVNEFQQTFHTSFFEHTLDGI
eukprot:SAG31_NODE_330_length_17593_cov_4.817891_8_plen_75_part_00